jgi:LPXTG-site transpeptidase (sortase) family protein
MLYHPVIDFYTHSLYYTQPMTPTVTRNHKTGTPAFWQHRFSYTAIAAGVAAVAYLLFYMIGLVPSELRYEPAVPYMQINTVVETTVNELESVMPTTEEPQRITIDKIGVSAVVKNPVSTNVNTLNNYLAEGAVRYPGSGLPGNGNLFMFGHSTGLSNVWNQAYKTFNGLGELVKGDTIQVDTVSGTYTYRVIDVEFKQDAAIFVPFDGGENLLTISTCNDFGSKEDRIVVRATFSGFSPHTN